MEFTPKKTTKAAIRHNPYASGGKMYLSNFHKRKSTIQDVTPPRKFGYFYKRASKIQDVTPPRKFGLVNSKSFENKNDSSAKVKFPQSSHILQNSQVQNSIKTYSHLSSKWISKVDYYDSSSKRKKELLKDVHSLDISNDPYNVFTDDDDDDDDAVFLSSKHEKMLKGNVDKENNNNLMLHPSKYCPTINANNITPKKKSLNIVRSSLLHDVSPQKVKLALGSDKRNVVSNDTVNIKLKHFEEKENLSVEKEELNYSEIEHPHMIGFPNFGNTCYLNAVLQTIVSLQPFVIDLSNIVEKDVVPSGSITHSLWNIIVARQKLDSSVLKPSLRTLKENVEKLDGSFCGFKMQDANEFLTQVFDMVKDEICKFTSQTLNYSVRNPQNTPDKKTLLLCENQSENIVHESTNNNVNSKEVNPCTSTCIFGSPSSSISLDKCTSSIFDTPSSSSLVSLGTRGKESCEHSLNDDEDVFLTPLKQTLCVEWEDEKNFLINPVNPVISNFEFELLESFRCLGCGETEGKKQKHFALYVDLPNEGDESIQRAVEAYMGEDHRDLTCEKCKHKKASFLTSFIKLPRFLIVQMKRYEYKPKQNECIKISSKVNVNMWLHLDKLTSKDTTLPPSFSAELLSKELKYNGSQSLSMPNNCLGSSGDCSVTSSNSDFKTPTKNRENKELEEVTIRTFEEVGDANQRIENGADKEEEEFQRAIKLSLQDNGTCFTCDKPAEASERSKQKVEDAGEGEEKYGKHSYHLLSVISHFGLTTCTGHYVSDVLNIRKGEWYHYDDECVTSLPESVVLSEGRQKNGYIFFYIHRDIYNALRIKNI